MSNSVQVDVSHFNERGYVIVKDVFSVTEIQTLQEKIQSVKTAAQRNKNYVPDPTQPRLVLILGDLLSHKELEDQDYVIFDQRIVSCVKQILGSRIVYFGDSSVQTGEGTRGFHKDNVDRYDGSGADWQGDYPLVRVGVYLQDNTKRGGGLKLRVKSHLNPSYHAGKAINVKNALGDVVMWNLRTTHSGNNVRLKGLPNLCLHPRLETLVPEYLRVSQQGERIAIFGTFGAPSSHLDRYIDNMVRRGDYHDYLRRAGYNRKILALAQAREVEMRRPIPDYGSLYPEFEPVETMVQ